MEEPVRVGEKLGLGVSVDENVCDWLAVKEVEAVAAWEVVSVCELVCVLLALCVIEVVDPWDGDWVNDGVVD